MYLFNAFFRPIKQASFFIVLLLSVLGALNSVASAKSRVTEFPQSIDKSCRDGRAKVYDECSDQFTVLNAAKASAAESGKTVLVVYGAEWCIWCHVFDKYIAGQSRKFKYDYENEGERRKFKLRERENKNAKKEAKALNNYVAENFVVVHIESYFSPNGTEVINSTGYDGDSIRSIPFIMAIDEEGQYADHMPPYSDVEGMEIRQDSGEEFRGFDRVILLEQLRKLRTSALGNR